MSLQVRIRGGAKRHDVAKLNTMHVYTVDTHGRFQPHVAKEWLLTNGIGGFACGTVVGCNTRRYHSLLNAALLPPVGRVATLARVGEILCLDGRADHPLELSVNQFGGGSVHPHGYRYLRRFEKGPSVRWAFDVEGVTVEKELRLTHRRNLATLRYLIRSDRPRRFEFKVLPFVALRDFHALRRSAGAAIRAHSSDRHVEVADGPLRLHLLADAGCFVPAGDWWYGHVLPVESERGQDDVEDLFVPGFYVLEGQDQAAFELRFSTDDPSTWPPSIPPDAHASSVAAPVGPVARLVEAAADFVVRRRYADGSDGATILAGYPWFADWGRDAMISLPGLLLTPGRLAEAAEVLGVYADHVSEGMIPNRFDDYTNQPSYNTVDASLWFIHAAFAFRDAGGDAGVFEGRLLPACRAIIGGYRRGTRYHIRMDERDGLIASGDESTQLTWMDAKHNGIAFTPRQGKAVEINALWYHALVLMGETDLARRVRESFNAAFWQNPYRGLLDCIDGDRRDASIRPNQIFAVSLANSPLEEDRQRAVVEVVRRELLTPFGLRTLAPSDPRYRGRYTGPQSQRDAAYHNGTVWPWLLGPFLEAYLRVNARSAESVEQARQWLQPLIDHLEEGCLGQLPEVFDGDPPHRPVGAFAQAWSVAEVLRIAAMLG